jgi:hypothetical protein
MLTCCYEHSEQARAPHTNGPRDVPRCGALSLLQKPLHYKGGSAKIVPSSCVCGPWPSCFLSSVSLGSFSSRAVSPENPWFLASSPGTKLCRGFCRSLSGTNSRRCREGALQVHLSVKVGRLGRSPDPVKVPIAWD